MKGLRRLNLRGNQIQDIEPLVELIDLMSLKLDNNQISDISVVENYKSLETLYIDENPIEDFASIRRLMMERERFILDIKIPPAETEDNARATLFPEAIKRLGKGGINTLRFSPDGSHLAVGTSIGIWVYNVANGDEKIMKMVYPEQVNSLAFSPDGTTLASSGYANKVIHLWDTKTGMEISSLRPSPAEKDRFSAARFNYASNLGLAFSKNGTTLIGISNRPVSVSIAHWEVNTGKELAKHHYLDQAITAAINNNTSTVALGLHDGKVSLWDSETGKKAGVLNGHSKFFLKEFHAKLFKKHKGHKYQGIQALAFSADGSTLATAGLDNLVHLWNVTSHKKQKTLTGHTGWITALAFSIDDKTVASGDIHGNIRLWEVRLGSERVTLNGHRSSVSVLTFSPDKQTLASASDDGTIKLWDANTGTKSFYPCH